ncbi:hypothetical protein [Pedobacter sp. CFBP9032]|uniref:hypothetical protein n=1 Tax=Pedobacter sp. CFBP9032 TaxID=3096539 RepID=UPI002A6B63FF|nr:hypothetical protein [Pedobacter sp. CFBP9032]MDY0904888.1 hypothetical protein [Pedobacter sp. CFBP9032]
METLKIDLENCYGINKLVHEFKFSESKAQLIYAPNGVMKSSLTQTFEDIVLAKQSQDRIFKNRPNKREITVDGAELNPEDIFVIQRMKEASFKEATTILVNKALREKYNELVEKTTDAKAAFIKLIQPNFGIKDNLIETEINMLFRKDFFVVLEELKNDVREQDKPHHENIIYNEVFNEKVLKFLSSKSFNTKIVEYISIYDSLVNKNDSLFMKGTFNHYNADIVSKSLKENKFFAAKHKIKIKDQEIDNIADLEALIESEREKVLKDPELKGKFDEIDKALNGNLELRKFRAYVEDNQEILAELADLDGFRKKLILNYFVLHKVDFDHLLKINTDTEVERKKIIDEASSEHEEWKNVIRVFKERFSVPFEIMIGNQHEVILYDKPASLVFRYSDAFDHVDMGGPELQVSLSTGEQRVFYILDIIFQFEVKRKTGNKQLVIVDDIADSFDYRNKYAIIQYLKDISEEDNFFMIVLTHNFDFYRTFKSRLGDKINYQGNWMALKGAGETKLTVGEKRDVFPQLRLKYSECDLSFIACIPFVRNLVEFTAGDDHLSYLTLTSLLHMKPARTNPAVASTADLTKGEIHDLFSSIFGLIPPCTDRDKKVLDLIYEKAAAIIGDLENFNFTDLKLKLVLSLAIRIKAEEYMLSKIANAQFLNNIHKKMTGKILKQFRIENPNASADLIIMDSVNLMTAENIHVNSFMYEPLMDLSIEHLNKLYVDVFSLI